MSHLTLERTTQQINFKRKHFKDIVGIQARSQDFFVGDGYLKNRDQIMNVLNDTLC